MCVQVIWIELVRWGLLGKSAETLKVPIDAEPSIAVLVPSIICGARAIMVLGYIILMPSAHVSILLSALFSSLPG